MHVEAGGCCIMQVIGQLLHVLVKKPATGAEDHGSSLAYVGPAAYASLARQEGLSSLCVDTKAGRQDRHAHHVQRVN